MRMTFSGFLIAVLSKIIRKAVKLLHSRLNVRFVKAEEGKDQVILGLPFGLPLDCDINDHFGQLDLLAVPFKGYRNLDC